MQVTVSVRGSRRGGGHRLLIAADQRQLETPPVEHLTFYLTLGILAAAEIIEWPVALALTAGHVLTGLTARPALSELGEGLETA